MKTRVWVATAFVAFVLSGCSKEPAVSPEAVRKIAKEAYIYGFPIVDNYRVLYSYFIDTTDPEYKGPTNQVLNVARVYTPADKSIQTPNADTPYSFVGADLRAEPLVFVVPPVEEGRYYSLQFVDLYTYNFAYVGSRSTGNDGGTYMLAGPNWTGEAPPDVKQVFRCETEIALVGYRTQLLGEKDLHNVEEIQNRYKVYTLSQYLRTSDGSIPSTADFMKPLSAKDERTSLEFFNVLNFLLKFCPTHPTEQAKMARFATIGVGAGLTFDATKLAPEIAKAIEDGRADAWAAYDSLEKELAAGRITSADIFGTREYLGSHYLYRMAAAVDGIYGNSKEEAIYPAYVIDSDGQKLDANGNKYTLRFAPGQLPPVNAFWSLTMYDAKTRLLITNPIERYLINSPMVPKLKKDKDGGITLYIQYASPGPGKQANWLPAPNGPFFVAMRLYWPKPEAFDGTWKKPALDRVKSP